MYEKDYHTKLGDLLHTENFEKLENFKLEKEVARFRELLRETILCGFNDVSQRELDAKHSVSCLYGTAKMHKPESPLRPISQGYASLTNKAEKFLNKMLSPLSNLCEYLINDPKQFKERFLPITEIFDPSEHTVVSFDATKLFTSVDIEEVVDFALKQIYVRPRTFFNDKNKKGNYLPVPARFKFKKFLMGLLTDFSIVKTQIGTYKQVKGLAMGSPLSSLLSNLYVNMMEQRIVKNFEKSGVILCWLRFADDVLCVCKKSSVNIILTENFNNI